MRDPIGEINGYVREEIEALSTSQRKTLRALLYAGYKGEREEVLMGLLRLMGEDRISPSSLTESFVSSFEEEPEVVYWRIKPEFYRAVRKRLTETSP
ncbi:MAG: hypothetical protein D6733_05300 [Methanobacteriota archaeon]|nr:MAG: hypothetical protein D6733_05300 [Euryarchaeota archaeon]